MRVVVPDHLPDAVCGVGGQVLGRLDAEMLNIP
jgi:hypothetical protein